MSDCEILLSVRDTLAGTAGDLNWSAALALDDWDDITLSGIPPRVTGIHSGGIKLNGTIPPELGDLTNLEHLDLVFNDLSGPIPSELGNLTNLEVIELGYNELSGPIPPELGNLTNLEMLYLDNNKLSGSIPLELGDLINLGRLYLNDNELVGPIPPELGDLTNLEWLDLQGNDLCIPAAHQDDAFFRDLDFPICDEVELDIAVSPATSVAYTEEVTLMAEVSDPAQVASYRWAHVGGWHRIGTQQSLTLGGTDWPNSPGTRTFQVIVTLNDGSEITAEQAIAFTNPPPPPDVSVSIAVSPSTTVAYIDEVTLTANVSDPAQVASYRWAHVGGWHRIGTQQWVTLGGAGWPNSPGTRTFQAIVTLNDGSQVTAEQAITFTNP